MKTQLEEPNTELLDGLAERLEKALDTLEQTEKFAKARYQTDAFRLATDLMDREGGLEKLYHYAPRFDQVGLFYGGPWQEPTKLLPTLVASCLKGEGMYPTLELLSELRMLVIATGKAQHPEVSASEAQRFLKTTMALNLDLLFPESTEESRLRPKVFQRAYRLFELIKAEISLDGLQDQLLEEIEFLLAQRPIQSDRLIKLITYVHKLPIMDPAQPQSKALNMYYDAVTRPSPLSKEVAEGDVAAYRKSLLKAGQSELMAEVRAFKKVLKKTGLGNPFHAVLLRFLSRKHPHHLPEALALDKVGIAAFEAHQEFALQLLKVAIFPTTSQAIYGYSRVIYRGLLSRPEVSNGLRQLVELDIAKEVQDKLLTAMPADAGLTPNSILVSSILSVLGQPLGIGQGNNPTCQAARGISLWAQHAPGYLLQIVTTAARNNVIEMDFEGQRLSSNALEGGVASGRFDNTLDPVSMIVVPHLDKLYDAMMRMASLRGEDQHKWVNPVFYGRWVPKGFASVFDVVSGTIKDYPAFVRRFYATHHPDYNDGSPLVYPNPVGIFVTDIHGQLLGLHAVSIQRIADDPSGELRVYFYNPNNESRQQWGKTIETSVAGHGEQPGESSLPFEHFTSRLYAFHYNLYEEGDAFAVPQPLIKELETAARESWGASYTWS